MATKKLSINIPARSVLTEEISIIQEKYNKIIEDLKHMNGIYVMELFGVTDISNIKLLRVNKVGFMFEHYFIYIKSLMVGDEEVIVNQMFYKSSGKSRKSGLEDIWLPTTGINTAGFIEKLEDEHILYYETLKRNKDYNKKYINEDLLLYKRFINKLNVLISKFLFEQERISKDIFKGDKYLDNTNSMIIIRDLAAKLGHYNYSYNEIIPDLEDNIVTINKNQTGGSKKRFKLINILF